MNCGICKKTDGMCYASYPPQVRCTITGKYHQYNDECDVPDKTMEKRGKLAGFLTEELLEEIRRRPGESYPCELCAYYPPSSLGGKPCSVCPASGIR